MANIVVHETALQSNTRLTRLLTYTYRIWCIAYISSSTSLSRPAQALIMDQENSFLYMP